MGTEERCVRRAEIVRSKLIQSFYLIDQLQEGQRGSPKYSIRDVFDSQTLRGKDSHQLVRFEISQGDHIISMEDRRRSRLRNCHRRFPPLNMFSHWVIESHLFSNIIVALIIFNTIVLEIQAEIFDNMDPKLELLRLILDMMDWSILAIFFLEMLLKWLDNFRHFWKSTWNIFDFVVTFLSVVPQIIRAVGGANTSHIQVVEYLRKLRILRALKMVSKFRQIRLIVLTVSKAFKAMSFIFLLLLVFAYIFAVVGVILFQAYTRSDVSGLTYHDSFKDIMNSFITLFILFTLDHWYAILADTRKVPEMDPNICGVYIILWLIIGAVIFRNIFVGILVNNFQSIRQDLSREVQQIENQQKADHFKAEFINRRKSHLMLPQLPQIAQELEETPIDPTEISNMNVYSTKDKDWETYVEENVTVMQNQEMDEQVFWPRDSLFKYFELLELLQLNLDNRKRLQGLAAQALLNLHDS
ncbi:cation channel sperm-associated protein 2-like isoform X2 [Alosa alosa]|uniref:cation channel sperm-associated protein 2-like isoform X2 n=1 Tax=Alosa sapidissima TaxID=34773 RepID=UPI001C0A003C|nr:cation channel sperm-associated protein 2-like isoform X2 [Alosa sapidissima]XP_048112197.1 cation channel sperm-associated protein 2-like isoform X2 [Alosa alosa]